MMAEKLLTLLYVAETLNRTLVIPPLECVGERRLKWKYCILCAFDGMDCFGEVLGSRKDRVRESVFFTNEFVPQAIRNKDKFNPIYSFEPGCQPLSHYRSDFPAHVDHDHEVKCVPCSQSRTDCAVQYGMGRDETVLKLYSI